MEASLTVALMMLLWNDTLNSFPIPKLHSFFLSSLERNRRGFLIDASAIGEIWMLLLSFWIQGFFLEMKKRKTGGFYMRFLVWALIAEWQFYRVGGQYLESWLVGASAFFELRSGIHVGLVLSLLTSLPVLVSCVVRHRNQGIGFLVSDFILLCFLSERKGMGFLW